MQGKRKKLWIILAVICVILITLGVVFALLFRLKKVDVEFLARESDTMLDSGITEKVKEDGKFDYGKNLFFLNLDDSIARIEKANPFVKVQSVKKHFPNIVRIHIVERVPQYRIQDKNNDLRWFILDDEFKILSTISADDLVTSVYYEKTVEISPNTLTIADSYIGDFVTVENNYGEYLNLVCDGIYGKTKDAASAYQIEISSGEGDQLEFIITMRNSSLTDGKGCNIKVLGTDDLVRKVFVGVSAFEQETAEKPELNTPDSTIVIEKFGDGYRGILEVKQG